MISTGYIIAGLGNPGSKYDGTRHNVGFAVLDALAERLGVKIKKLKFQALYGEGVIAGKKVVLLKPQTFMNLSGRSVRECLDFYKTPLDSLIVVYDDAALPAGKIRVRPAGSDGGHNGIKDILYQLQTDAFPRVKIGVGAPPNTGYDMADWVLSGFSEQDKKLIGGALEKACDAAEHIISRGVQSAMNSFNGGEPRRDSPEDQQV